MLNGLDLFSGIGGISIGLTEWVRAIAYCEQDRYCQGVLMSRMSEGMLHTAPIWDDVRTLSSEQFRIPIDIVFGGFPCQDISVAGNGVGLEGERSSLYFEIVRLCRELRPRFVFLENVQAITIRGLDRVLLELTALGYDSRWTIVSASEFGAPHLRERWFLLAHANSDGIWSESISKHERKSKTISIDHGSKEFMADTNSVRKLQPQGSKQDEWGRSSHSSWWSIEPEVGRMANGISFRVDRIKGLGNSVVPMQAREAFKRLMGLN